MENQPMVLGEEDGSYDFYSEDWRERKGVAISLPYFDVMVKDEYLYLIKLGTFNKSIFWMILGLVIGPIGAAAGYYSGNSRDTKKRKLFRFTWIDMKGSLISKMYEQATILKIPKSDWKSSLILEKHKIIITWNNQRYIFTKNRDEILRLESAFK